MQSPAVERALTQLQSNPAAAIADADHSFVARSVVLDKNGAEHVRLDRLYKGLRVLGGDIVVHADDKGLFAGVTHGLSAPIAMDVRPTLDTNQAVVNGMNAFPGAFDAPGVAELVVYTGDAGVHLAYDVFIEGIMPDQTPSRLHVIVDAHSGAVVDRWDEIMTHHGTGTGFHNGEGLEISTWEFGTDGGEGTGFGMRDHARGDSETVDMNNSTFGSGSLFRDPDNNWGVDGQQAERQKGGVDAHWGGQKTWDYFLNVHGRNGIAGDGQGATQRVHYGRNYANAFWSDACFCMTYGDGDSELHPLNALDVVAHEMSHGVTSRTANLRYSGESGGLNEGTSDIFAAAVEFYAQAPDDPPDYWVGEKVFKAGGALRYMENPERDGRSKGCWSSSVGSIDVHYSSGVANHFFYLLAEGSASPDTHTCNTNTTVSGIGIDKAGKIWFKALTAYMTSTTNYRQARTATVRAATDLFGADSAEVDAVEAAWTAVKVAAQ
jgi:Zn-dependent metalloprotease